MTTAGVEPAISWLPNRSQTRYHFARRPWNLFIFGYIYRVLTVYIMVRWVTCSCLSPTFCFRFGATFYDITAPRTLWRRLYSGRWSILNNSYHRQFCVTVLGNQILKRDEGYPRHTQRYIPINHFHPRTESDVSNTLCCISSTRILADTHSKVSKSDATDNSNFLWRSWRWSIHCWHTTMWWACVRFQIYL